MAGSLQSPGWFESGLREDLAGEESGRRSRRVAARRDERDAQAQSYSSGGDSFDQAQSGERARVGRRANLERDEDPTRLSANDHSLADQGSSRGRLGRAPNDTATRQAALAALRLRHRSHSVPRPRPRQFVVLPLVRSARQLGGHACSFGTAAALP
ncbi:hypothetical protein AAT19DRAFT_10639 [Rhodotorula toruloides]|uniref:Uncharacterized protein n=1 Tax=Rhodotorula toruloides TaxID=5286 RepID=A0A2S9ZZB6_RHOTO|nr:hypothetical protein AAT19DRAFT_10639 [Rhodotorula toruloides]